MLKINRPGFPITKVGKACTTIIGLLLLASVSAKPIIHTAESPLPPSEAAETMKLPEGFSATLFAGEPDVLQPVALCIDSRGRLWVAENHSYPKHTDKPASDRIVIFEDTDLDGKHDKRTVFYDKLNYVSGLEVGFGGVWVMSPPYFYFIPDKDKDDQPDSPPKLLLDGFGNHSNSHNIANGFAWGPDGWLYATHGRTNWSNIGKPGCSEEERIRFDGGVWRYHPTRHIWESYADGCTNPWGIDWNDHGQGFIPNTVGPHIYHVIQGAHYEPWRNRKSSQFAYKRIDTIADHFHFFKGKSFRSGLGTAEMDKLGGGHSHCGILIYKGDNWPDSYRNSVLLHNTHGRRINREVLERKGSGFVAKHRPDFMRSKDPWFMGVNFRTNYDGTVYVTDWSDTGECHSVRNTRKHTGRIYRIHYGKNPEKKPTDFEKLSNSELVKLLQHKNEWFSRHARRTLQERHASGKSVCSAKIELLEMFNEAKEIPLKLKAFWTLHVTGEADTTFLEEQLFNPNEHISAWAVTLLCENKSPSKTSLGKLEALAANGKSKLVRLHLASALQRVPPNSRGKLAESLISRTEDEDDQNLPLMYWYGIEPLINEDRIQFLSLAAKTKIPLLRQFITRRATEK